MSDIPKRPILTKTILENKQAFEFLIRNRKLDALRNYPCYPYPEKIPDTVKRWPKKTVEEIFKDIKEDQWRKPSSEEIISNVQDLYDMLNIDIKEEN